MAITSFQIDGEEVNPLLENFEIRESVGSVSTLVCDVESIGSPVTRIAVFSTVHVEEDGVTIFDGIINQARERGFGGPNIYDTDSGAPQIVTTITAEDHYRIAERVSVTLDIAEGTLLKAALTSLVGTASLVSLGVTLDPAQANGPALPAMQFERARAADVIRAFTDATGWLSRIDYDKQLRMWQPGDILAPFNIDEFDSPARWTDDVEVETILGDDYANRVIVIIDPKEEELRVETFVGDGVTDSFTLHYTLIEAYGIIHRFESDGTTQAGGETFAIEGQDTFTQWVYDPTYNTITRVIGPTDAGYIYKLTFHGTFSAEGTAEDPAEIAAHGLYEWIERRSDIDSQDAADDLAAQILADKLQAVQQKVTYRTRFQAPTLRAGQQQTITATARDLSGGYIVTEMRISAEVPVTSPYESSGLGFIRTIVAKEAQPMVGRWQDTYRDWLVRGGGATSAPALGEGGPVSVGPAPPDTANQFNDQGVFGGHPNWTFNKTYTTVMLGPNHTPGGADNMLSGEGHTVL